MDKPSGICSHFAQMTTTSWDFATISVAKKFAGNPGLVWRFSRVGEAYLNSERLGYIAHSSHVWYICLDFAWFFMVNVGRYTSFMDPTGRGSYNFFPSIHKAFNVRVVHINEMYYWGWEARGRNDSATHVDRVFWGHPTISHMIRLVTLYPCLCSFSLSTYAAKMRWKTPRIFGPRFLVLILFRRVLHWMKCLVSNLSHAVLQSLGTQKSYWKMIRVSLHQWSSFKFGGITLPKTNSSPLKIGLIPKENDRIPTIHFQVQTCC